MTALDDRPAARLDDNPGGQLAGARRLLDDMRAAFLARSDERDMWSRYALDGWADGYRAGFASGEGVGAERAILAWKITAGALPLSAGGPSFVEQDARRYPSPDPARPDGRLSWIIPRGAERCAHESVGQPCPDDYATCPYRAEGGPR